MCGFRLQGIRRFVPRIASCVAWVSLVVAAGCTPFGETPDKTPPRADVLVLELASFVDLPGWSSGRQAGAIGALRRSCVSKTITRPPKWPNDVLPRDASNMCAAALALNMAGDGTAVDNRARVF